MRSSPQSPDGQDRTLTSVDAQPEGQGHVLGLTIVWHPDARRIGAQAVLAQPGDTVALGRFSPLFRSPGAGPGEPLGHAAISRNPMLLHWQADDTVVLQPSEGRMSCEVGGVPLASTLRLAAQAVNAGIPLLLAGQIALCLHRVSTLPSLPGTGDLGLVGVSSAVARLRQQIRLAGPTALPVLVLGETGTGKELVAQAMHGLSERRSRPMVSVNMAALTDSLATADLFGSTRGAYTGAQGARQGFWPLAHGSTLFLDEVGDTPASVQPMLLRALETGEYRALGASEAARADVRVVAATDRDLAAGGFNQPLRRRLEGVVLHTEPLRRRREDIGVLMQHLLGGALAQPQAAAALPLPLLRALCLHDWPGNVRQLAHAAHRLALAWSHGIWPSVEEFLGEPLSDAHGPTIAATFPSALPGPAPVVPEVPSAAAPAPPPKARYLAPGCVNPAQVLQALAQADWCVQSAARALGVSRPSLYNLLPACGVRPAEALGEDEIRAAWRPDLRSVGELAGRLKTTRESLRRRLRALGLPPLS